MNEQDDRHPALFLTSSLVCAGLLGYRLSLTLHASVCKWGRATVRRSTVKLMAMLKAYRNRDRLKVDVAWHSCEDVYHHGIEQAQY